MADFSQQVNKPVTFSANDTSMISHVWKINGVQESTNPSFSKTFSQAGTYTVSHEGANSCGSCPAGGTVKTVEITTATSGGTDNTLLYLGIGAAAIVGLAWMSSQQPAGGVRKL